MTKLEELLEWMDDAEYAPSYGELREKIKQLITEEQQVKSVDLADVVGSLPALSADFENIIGRSYPIKDSEPSEYFETLKYAGNGCAEWVHHKIKVSGQ
jgi:hypothetical protein